MPHRAADQLEEASQLTPATAGSGSLCGPGRYFREAIFRQRGSLIEPAVPSSLPRVSWIGPCPGIKRFVCGPDSPCGFAKPVPRAPSRLAWAV